MNKKNKQAFSLASFSKPVLSTIFLYSSFFLFSGIFFLLYYFQIVTFGFVDEYTNFVAGYFVANGKILYRDIFYHHQLLPVYLSALIEITFHPESLYKLVFYHRIFVMVFSLFMSLLIVYRFRYIGLGIVILYELTKYYFFGNLFLAEALITYPFIYLFGLVLLTFQKKKITNIDLIISGLFSWFIIFMREPFIPAAIVLYGLVLYKGKSLKTVYVSLFLFLLLSFLTIFTTSIKDYIFNVVTVNFTQVIPDEASGTGIKGLGVVKIFFYPLFIIFEGKWNFLYIILLALDAIFLVGIGYLFFKRKIVEAVIIMLVLGLTAVRAIPPATMFYEAYRMLPWYGLFITTCIFFVYIFALHTKKVYGVIIFAILFLICISPVSFIWQEIDREKQFNIHYGRFFSYGETIRILAKDPNDKLFIDFWDSLIYWQAKVPSSYTYIFYYPVNINIPFYSQERERMFQNNPPVFYYTDCQNKQKQSQFLPAYVINRYIQLRQGNKPTCLYIRKDKVEDLTAEQHKEIEKFGFSL